MFPSPSSLNKDVDLADLAKRFPFAGGNIKNAALMSAIYAAGRNKQNITQSDLIYASTVELTKMKNRVIIGFGQKKIGASDAEDAV
jgi:ATP-dependent Zn protease